MARHSVVVGLDNVAATVAFTAEQEAAADAVEAADLAAKPSRDAQDEINRLEAEITLRRQREAGADDAGGSQSGRDWMKAQEAKIATERGKL